MPRAPLAQADSTGFLRLPALLTVPCDAPGTWAQDGDLTTAAQVLYWSSHLFLDSPSWGAMRTAWEWPPHLPDEGGGEMSEPRAAWERRRAGAREEGPGEWKQCGSPGRGEFQRGVGEWKPSREEWLKGKWTSYSGGEQSLAWRLCSDTWHIHKKHEKGWWFSIPPR